MPTQSAELYTATVAGQGRQARSGETLESINPATGEVIGRFPRFTKEDIDLTVEAASAAQPAWAALSTVERANFLKQVAEVLRREGESLARLDAADNGSTLSMLRVDSHHAIEQLDYFAGMALRPFGETLPTTPGRVNYTVSQPWGVVARIIPFNHPLMFAAAKMAAPLMAGNTLIIKPSEHTSLSALRLGELLRDVLPAGVLNIVTGLGLEAGDALVTHPAVRRIAFIGSVPNGQVIQRRAAESGVKSVTLELGGKNPLVVFPDADQELALDGAQRGMNFTWQGQSCGSTSRLLVHRDIHREFVDRLANRIGSLKPGMPEDESAQTGAIVNQGQLDKVERYIRIGKDEGAHLVTGGVRADEPELRKGLFIRPAVFDNVKWDSRLAQEEIFGPVLAVIPFDDYADAVRIANSVDFGLTASVFTRDLQTAHSFVQDVQAGYVWVNDSSRHILGAPFGGTKDSGIGREESTDELESYSQLKNVHIRFSD